MKARVFWLFFGFMLILGAVANVRAAGYVCDSAAKYTSCGAGFFMRYNGAYNGTPTTGNICSSCTDYAPRAEFCPGGTYAPAYKVTLNPNGGSGGLSQLYTVKGIAWFTSLKKTTGTPATSAAAIGATVSTLSASQLPTRTGYTFNGFYTAASGGSQIISSAGAITGSNPNGNDQATLYAQWTAISKTCSAGQYFNVTDCADCASGYYCPNGSKTYTYNGSIQGRSDCPTGYAQSDAKATSASKCYVTTTAGKYIANANDSAQTTCSENNYCPGGVKVTYGSTGGVNACPDPSTHIPTNLPSSDYVANRKEYAYWLNVGLSDINRCAATFGFSTNKGYVTYEGVRYDSSVGKYGMTTSSIYWSRVNPGYYLKTRYLEDYCSSNTSRSMLYREVSTCPAGSYCPGGSVPGCSSGTYNDTFGVYACPANSTSSAGSSYCTCKNGYLANGSLTTTTTACTPFVPEVKITTVDNPAAAFTFSLTAKGTFYVDLGDGSAIKVINKTNTNLESFTYGLIGSKSYVIGIAGQATEYNSASNMAAITFYGNTNIKSLSGSLGAIFGTLSNGSQPRFFQSFYNSTNLESIPSTLFDGITDQPVSNMFRSTFEGTALKTVPAGLFGGLDGSPASALFNATFAQCKSLTTIPSGLFGGIYGKPAGYMFADTFAGCSNLETVPSDLFARISGAPADYMYNNTFWGCSKLNFTIPSNFFGTFNGVPTERMFNSTFEGCSSLNSEIPSDLFAGISGAPNTRMFRRMFYACSKVHGDIPNDLFAGISKTTTATDQMTEVFTGSGLITSCPAGEYQYMTGFESYFGGKVSCTPCPNGYDDGGAGLTAINQCQMTVESGKYIATSGAATVTNCPVNNMCPGGKVNYTDTGIISACPTNSSTNAKTGQASCTCNTGYNYNGGTTATTNACEANTFILKHVSDDTVFKEKTCTYGSACAITTGAPSKTGHTFAGWLYNGKTYTSGQDVTNLVSTNGTTITLTAQWTAKSYTCGAGKYLDGTECKDCTSGYYCPGDTYTYNAGIQGRSTCPTIYNNSDAGASSNKQCYIITEAGKMILYPSSGTEVTCSANYYCSGGVKIYYGEYGGSTACPANSSTNGATGQTKCTCNTGYNYNDGTTTASDACVANTYIINYDSVGGSAIPDTLCIYGQNCTVSSTKPTKTGYTFTGWLYNNITYQADDTVPSLTSINGDTVTFTAQWQPNTFTIIYVSNDGSGNMENTTCTYDTDCYITKNTYTRTGYTFKNWANYDKSQYFEDGVNLKNVTSKQGTALFLYAQWEPITYTITYDKNGGSGSMANTKCTYGTLCVLDKNTFYKAGYEFDGWLFNNEKYTDGQSVSDLTVVNTDNLVFVAQWKPAVISCPAGQYLNGLNCNNCEDEYYCEGGEWLYDGGIHGKTDCPAVDETYGSAQFEFLDVLGHTPHASVEDCRVTFVYMPEWSKPLNPDTEFNAGYNPQANNRGVYFVSCDYNSDTKQYDSNCTGFPLSCGAGYVSSTNVDLATDFEDLSKNLYYANSPQDAIEKTCVPVGRNNWSSSGQECIGLPDDEGVFCLYEKSLEKNACPDGGITLTDTSGAITDCLKNDVECSTELGDGIKTCSYDEATGAYDNCGECSVDSCKSGYYMNNGICTTCPAGSACTDNVITTCGANTWTTTNSAQCNTCPANSSTNGQTGQTQCVCDTGYNYNNGTQVTVNDCVPNTFTVKYDAGLGDGNMADTVCDYDGGCVAANNAFVMTGYNFVGWLCSGGSCDGKVIQPGASLVNATAENNAVINLTAQWSISSISCDAGYYLNGDVCAECPDDSFCTGGAWEYNGQIQGLEKCPTITEKYGAASAEFLDVLEHAPHSAANQCRAVFGYAERWYLDFVNNTNVDAGYDEKVNERGLFFVSCDYNPVTRLYDKNCTGVALMCGAGYWSPYNQNTTDVNDLIQNMYIANSPQDAIENTCTQVGDGYWSPSAEGKLDKDANDLLQQLTLQYVGRTQCKDGLHTAGYGKGADEEDDCGRILHIDESVVYLRKDKRTIPSLNVRVDGVVYYGSMSTQETNMNDKSERKLRINYKGVPYWVHDDTML